MPRATVKPSEVSLVDGVIDPTLNVKQLVDLQVQRQDDLRWAEARAVRELMGQRDGYEGRIMAMILQHQKELADKETQRLDAIRAVDRDAVTRAAEVSTQQAQTLASTVATSAEALRGQVEAQRVTTADALSAALGPITTRLDGLLAAQFARQGGDASKLEGKGQDQFKTSTIISIIAAVMAGLLTMAAILISALGLYFSTSKKTPAPTLGVPVACSAPGLLPGQVCTTNAPK